MLIYEFLSNYTTNNNELMKGINLYLQTEFVYLTNDLRIKQRQVKTFNRSINKLKKNY